MKTIIETPEVRLKGSVGQKLGSGEVVITKTGRKTTPFPKVNLASNRGATKTVREVARWLVENAIAEAESIGDEFNAHQFGANPKSPSQADKDSAEEYLFGVSAPIQPPLLKPVATCPNCGGTDMDTIRNAATFALPECSYRICNECGAKSDPQ